MLKTSIAFARESTSLQTSQSCQQLGQCDISASATLRLLQQLWSWYFWCNNRVRCDAIIHSPFNRRDNFIMDLNILSADDFRWRFEFSIRLSLPRWRSTFHIDALFLFMLWRFDYFYLKSNLNFMLLSLFWTFDSLLCRARKQVRWRTIARVA